MEPISKPTTPKSRSRRQLQRSSGVFGLLPQSPKIHYPVDADNLPLESAANTERFEQLSDAMEELEVNMSNLQQIHDLISRGFNESFSSLLYGLSMTMWCVDFPGNPSKAQWEKLNLSNEIDERIHKLNERIKTLKQENQTLNIKLANNNKLKTNILKNSKRTNIDDSFNSTDNSFINNPSRIPNKKITNYKPTMSKPPVPSLTGDGPNLNQPPRYMNGLFNARPRRKIENKPMRIHNRPPFR